MMCGFAGYLSPKKITGSPESLLTEMSDQLTHRGPDDSGWWADVEAGFGVSHRRLSILDLSAAGHQPMLSQCGRWVLSYNGEIYNHMELRSELADESSEIRWSGHSDTETLLECLRCWGVEGTLNRINGMFAFALWDRTNRSLYIARDRMGEKPLYYGMVNGDILFGSELKALRRHPSLDMDVDRDSLSLFLQFSYIPAPYSIYRNVKKLPPGTFLEIRLGEALKEPEAYWSLCQVAKIQESNLYSDSDKEALEKLETILGGVVRKQMISDVPLGVFLSGGIDSTLVASVAQQESATPIQTFTLGFSDQNFDESAYARKVAKKLGTVHSEMRFEPLEALEALPKVIAAYDEPFADSSQLPTYMVSMLARQKVSVALTGDGADELFGGYNRYVQIPELWERVQKFPPFLRGMLGAGLMGTGRAMHAGNRVLQSRKFSNLGEKLKRYGFRFSNSHSFADFGSSYPTTWRPNPERVVLGSSPNIDMSFEKKGWSELSSMFSQLMALDGVHFLPDDLLVKVDRASMAVSLECRAPYLDREVVEFAWSLPLGMKRRDGQSKWILRQLIYKYVPRELIDRPKTGFSIPLASWLRGPLRPWVEELISEQRLKREGYFNPSMVREAWNRHLSYGENMGGPLWPILMFQAWLDAQ